MRMDAILLAENYGLHLLCWASGIDGRISGSIPFIKPRINERHVQGPSLPFAFVGVLAWRIIYKTGSYGIL
jgi:hypothetical protein